MKELLTKLIDNFNLGKFVSDLISGSVLAFALLLLVALATGVRVFPAEDLPRLKTQLSLKQAAQARQALHLRLALVAFTKKEAGTPEPSDVDALEEAARTAIAASTGKDSQSPYLSRLNADLTGLAAIRSDLQQLEGRLANATTVAGNLTLDSASVGVFLAVSLICGVVISQVARIAFIRFAYLVFLRRDERPGGEALLRLDSDDLRKTNDYIVTYYYRYAEAGANLTLPLLLVAFVGPRFLLSRGLVASQAALGVLQYGLVLTAIVMFVAGGFAYKFYRRKLKDNVPQVVSA